MSPEPVRGLNEGVGSAFTLPSPDGFFKIEKALDRGRQRAISQTWPAGGRIDTPGKVGHLVPLTESAVYVTDVVIEHRHQWRPCRCVGEVTVRGVTVVPQ